MSFNDTVDLLNISKNDQGTIETQKKLDKNYMIDITNSFIS